jgi:hypothetical protein
LCDHFFFLHEALGISYTVVLVGTQLIVGMCVGRLMTEEGGGEMARGGDGIGDGERGKRGESTSSSRIGGSSTSAETATSMRVWKSKVDSAETVGVGCCVTLLCILFFTLVEVGGAGFGLY